MSKKLFEEHKELMHYTSASGLHGIVTSKTLWASHTSFLNDTEEIKGFFDRVLPLILKPEFKRYGRASSGFAEDTRVAEELGVDLFDHRFRKIVEDFWEAGARAEDHYVASFCTTEDEWISQNGLLSQWRGYGLDGGYALVFDREELGVLLDRESKIYHEERLSLGDVQYRLSEDLDVNDRQVQEHISRIKGAAYEYWRTDDIEQAYPAFDSIALLATFCKHRGFEEEQEVRIVITEPSVEIGPDPEKPDDKPYRKAHSYFRNGAAIPCVHLFGNQKLKILPIRRIIVGPHLDKKDRKKAVEILLRNHGSDAEVVVSDTPFRGK